MTNKSYSIRLTPEDKAALERVAAHYRNDLSGIIRAQIHRIDKQIVRRRQRGAPRLLVLRRVREKVGE